jgi:hypothetical protein
VRGVRRIVFLLTTLSVVAACGGGGDHHEASPTRSSTALGGSNTTTTTAPATTTTLDPTRTAILAAYRAHWADIEAVDTHYPVDPTNQILTDHMAATELNFVRSSLTVLNHLGQVLKGPPVDTSMAMVKQLAGNAAVVVDCDFDQSVRVNVATGQTLDQPSAHRTLINAEMELVGAAWKVTKLNIVSQACSAAA